jgi:hypothetical protein
MNPFRTVTSSEERGEGEIKPYVIKEAELKN